MSPAQIIRHLHLAGTTPFACATAIQNILVRQHLDYKAQSSPDLPRPPATLLTFSPTPVYTTGRRELGTLSPSTISLLQEPLPEIKGNRGLYDGFANGFAPEVKETLRGGQITYHGPGQLVIYPILDLKAVKSEKWPKGLTARCFVNVLEQATINTLKTFGIQGIRTDNPGVWVDEEKKIAALGLHLRRNITSFGVGLNVKTDLRYFDKIVACGLEGKKTTSIKQELWEGKSKGQYFDGWNEGPTRDRARARYVQISNQMGMANLAGVWSREFGALVWGTEAFYKMYNTGRERVVAQFLDGRDRRVGVRFGGDGRRTDKMWRDIVRDELMHGYRRVRMERGDAVEEWLEEMWKEGDTQDR